MSEEMMKEIVERIKHRRLELGYSFQDLANLTGMSKSTLQRYEAGAIKNIPLDKLKILASALKVEPEWIMGWNENENKSPYYLDPEAAAIAQEVYERPEMRMLFDASRKISPEDMQLVISMIDRLKKDETPEVAINQIKEKEYIEKFRRENNNHLILAVAICYDSKTKEHNCKIEELR